MLEKTAKITVAIEYLEGALSEGASR